MLFASTTNVSHCSARGQIWPLTEVVDRRSAVSYQSSFSPAPATEGLTLKHRESDSAAQRGHITKEGSTLVLWAAWRTSPTSGAGANPSVV